MGTPAAPAEHCRAPALYGRLLEALQGRSTGQKPLIERPITSGDVRLACFATNDLYKLNKPLFGTEERPREQAVAQLLANAVNGEPPSAEVAGRWSQQCCLDVHAVIASSPRP